MAVRIGPPNVTVMRMYIAVIIQAMGASRTHQTIRLTRPRGAHCALQSLDVPDVERDQLQYVIRDEAGPRGYKGVVMCLDSFHQLEEDLSEQLMGGRDRNRAGLSCAKADPGGKDARPRRPRADGPQLASDLCVPFASDHKQVVRHRLGQLGHGQRSKGAPAVAHNDHD
eukprot:scaffold647819_cov38-Prasinocladus_malaysianus.AAC.4